MLGENQDSAHKFKLEDIPQVQQTLLAQKFQDPIT